MGSGNEPGNDELKEQALEMMEQSLAILYALQEPAAADLHDVIERVMGSSGKMGEEGEVWDSVFTDRDCQDFRVWAGIMGKKESHYVPTQGAGDFG